MIETHVGQISADQLYDPYGQVIDDNGTWTGSFGYAGEQTDESGLGYNRARYYHPQMGAFASLDPFEGIDLNPMSINRYGYVWGNPINRADSSGLCPQTTVEQTRIAIKTLQAANPSLMQVDGATADVVASVVCAAQDVGQYAPQIVTVGSTVIEVGVAIAGTGAAATAGVVLAVASVGILVGVGFYLGVLYSPVIPYTPEQLDDMRPPTPEWTPVGTPAPVGTPMPGNVEINPQFQPTPNPQLQPQPDITPVPTPNPQPQPQPDPGDIRPDPQPNDKCRDDNCTREEMERRIGTSTVAPEIVGNPNFYPNQDSVDRPYIVDIAVNMCKNGYNPAFPIEYWQFADRNVLIEGHHRFIASYVARVTPIFKGDDVRPIESPPHSRREWSQVRIR